MGIWTHRLASSGLVRSAWGIVSVGLERTNRHAGSPRDFLCVRASVKRTSALPQLPSTISTSDPRLTDRRSGTVT